MDVIDLLFSVSIGVFAAVFVARVGMAGVIALMPGRQVER